VIIRLFLCFFALENYLYGLHSASGGPEGERNVWLSKPQGSFPPAHPSTKAALTVLERLKIKKEARILDIGCGSGILGLTTVFKNSAMAIGCDINPASISASRENAIFNRMQDRFHLFCGSANAVSERFDLILANLPAGVHTQMFDHYRRLLLINQGLLVVSGFYDVQTAYMEKELARKGFAVLERVEVNASAAALTSECSCTWVSLGLTNRDF
jgi:ribosomal protein L11 methylase PrmA